MQNDQSSSYSGPEIAPPDDLVKVPTDGVGLIRQAFHFIRERAEAIDTARRAPFVTWLLDNPVEWIVPVAQRELLEATNEAITLLVGEEGSGKTTALSTARSRLEDDPTNLVAVVDFSTGTQIANPRNAIERAEWIARNIRIKIEEWLEKHPADFDAYNAEIIRMQVRTGNHALLREQKRTRWSAISTMTANELLADPQVNIAVRVAETAIPQDDILSLRAIQEVPNRRVVIVLDNPDHWGYAMVQDIFRTVTTQLVQDTVLLAAIRPNFERASIDYRQTPRLRTIYLHQHHNKDLVLRISRKRIRAVARWARVNQSSEVQEEVRRLQEYYKTTFDRIGVDKDVYRLVCRWTNYNYRQITDFFVSLKDAPDPLQNMSRWRSYVLRRLVKDTIPTHLLKIFQPDQRYCSMYPGLPFVFLRLRLLSYLKRQLGTGRYPTIHQIQSDFGSGFGISAGDIEGALRWLSAKAPSCGQLLRFVPEDGPAPLRAVVLLPAGELMINTLVFNMDFLSWCYMELGNPPETPEPEYWPRVKLSNAVGLLSGTILPAFYMEHPYMRVEVDPQRGEGDRLVKYGSMFGYGPGKWYIEELAASMRRYCGNKPGLMVAATEVLHELDECIYQLNHVFPGPLMST